MNFTKPLVTVVIAVKNAAATVGASIESALSQQEVPVEVIVIDGASTDGTLEILRSYSSRLSYISESDSGVYSAWNKGVARARGEWICFIGADDRFHERTSLAKLVAQAASGPQAALLVYGRLNLRAANGGVAQVLGKRWSECRDEFFSGVMIPHPGTLHHRSLFERYGTFDESFRIAGDYEFLLRALSECEPTFLDAVVVDMALGGLSMRPRTVQLGILEVIAARRRHGLVQVPWSLRRTLWTARLGALLHRLAGEKLFRVAADKYRLVRGLPPLWTR